MNETGLRRTLPDQSSGSGHTFDTPRHQSIIDPILSKRVCFYKSGDPQFNGLRMVINHRTFKTFDALLDSLSKKVPLPFGVRNITTPRGVHGIHTLDELEDGKSYICSDSHKVKPINLALARKKLPPWYHATPVSSRQRTLQQARFFPGRGIRRQEPVVVRTPKSLVVFCNGDPSIKHTVVLHKKTTPSYESILDYISELMQFHVVKLHTPDGRRVDGLPGLILGSGTVVAVGREPFRPAMYNAQKPPARARQHTKPVGIRRKRALKRKKKSPSYSSKSRNFSASSERYIVHQINNTIAESSCDLPSHTTNSVELDSNRMLESVAETEGDTCLGDGAEGQGCSLPDEDNIEKSFRVNQDGSMTVEMKVRLTIKEEETVHWTTTLTRSSVADQLNVNCLPEPEAEQDICSSKSNSLNSQSPTASIDTINKDKTKDNNDDDDPPSLGNGAMSDSSHEEDDIKIHTDVMSPRRAPTPGYRRMSKQQASVKSIKSVAADGIQEGLVGSYSYREQTENGTMTEQYCMVKQSTTRPVPKPRLFGSVDANSRNVSAFKSAEKPEKLQTESSGEEVTETVLHFYEQQTCQDNLQANVCAHSMSASGVSFGRSPTSETGQLSSNNESELERLRPSTASESISTWRAESMTVTSDSHLSSMKTGAIQGANRKQFHKVTKGHGKPQQKQLRVTPTEVSPPRGVLTRQTSMHLEKKSETESHDMSQSVSSPAFNSSSSVTKEYVESWLEKAHLNPPSLLDEKSGEVGNPVKISFERATLSDPLSMVQQPLPPELLNTEHSTKDVSSAASSPLYRLSSLSSQRSDNHPLSMSPTSEKDKSPTHNMLEKTSAQTDTSSTLQGAELSRTPSTKRAPLVTNLSLERKMSLRKACLDKYTLANDATKETTTLSNPINTVGDEVPPHDICSTATQLPIKAHPEESQQSVLDLMCTSSLCSSVSPASLTSDERMSPASNSSSEHLSKETKMTQIHQKEAPSPKTSVKTAKPKTSPSPERKFQNKKSSAEHQNNSPKLMPVHSPHMDKTVLPNNSTPKHSTPNASPSVDRKHHKPKAQQKTSPYSQSLDMASPPVRHKSSIQSLSRNLSTDNPSEPTSKKQNKTSSQRKSQETPQSGKSTAELDKTLTCETLTPLEADKSDEFKAVRADCDKSMMDLQIMPQQLNMANQPNMKPVLEKICYSIKSIRRITQNKRPSCLEKSNSLPDFSSHVASTFGSSSKALLAFLSVMTLKEGLVNLNVDELNANHVSCAEALKMIDSLREIASIEDSHKLKTSLSHLQQSASKQLLQSWKGFQELSGSRSSTPNASDPELITEAGPEQDIEEKVIDEIMDNLDIPEKLKEELASLSESDNERKMSPMIAKRLELTANQNSHEITKHPPTEDAVSQDEKANTDVRSISKTFTDINQPESEMNRLTLLTEAAKLKPTDHTKEQNGQDLPDSVTECLPAEPNSKQIPEESQLYSTTSFESCRDTVHQENQENVTQQQQGHKDKKSTQETANMSGELSINKNLENDSCSFKTKEQDVELRQLRMQSEESIPENEFTHDDESDSDEEEQKTSSANKDLNEKESCKHSSDEDDTEVKCEKIKQECSEGEDLSDPESHSEEDEDEQQGSNYNVEMNDIGRKSISNQDSENQHLSEEEQLEVEWQSSEKQQQSKMGSMGLNISADVSTEDSDADEPSSEDKQPVADSKKLQVILEESLSGNEEEQEEEHVHNLPNFGEQTKKSRELEALIEETEEEQVSSGDEGLHDETPEPAFNSDLIENSYNKNYDSTLIIAESLEKDFRFSADNDSGKDHSSCEEHIDEEELQGEDEQISSSIEEELSYYEKESCSEEEQATYLEERCARSQEDPVTTQPEGSKFMEKLKQNPGEIITQSVAERVILLEKQVAQSQKAKPTSQSTTIRHPSQIKATLESDEESTSESPTSEVALCTRSAPQSSLSFSYDSSRVITTEPEGRVRSIREMFLAKSATDIQQKRFLSPNVSEQSELKAETSGSGGYQSQTSGELSSGEDDSARKSITKGFVRRTIEMLYGKKDAKPEEASERPPSEPNQKKKEHSSIFSPFHAKPEEASERPPSEPNQEKKEHSSIFSPFHAVRSKAMSEMSYFNSTNALDVFSEATRCIAFHAQVGPGDSVPIDNGRWLLRENMLIRKSVSDPVGINKTFSNTTQDEGLCKDKEEKTPYSLFSTKPELEDNAEPLPRKCTYFSLPHANDSDICQDDQSTVSKSSVNGDSVAEDKDPSEDTKTWAERNGVLPSIGLTDFKGKGNKVYPLVELPPDGEVVLVQPGKGQRVVTRRLQEPDVLDLMYNFCGENCPIL
ncbi:uncharacterized protein PAE49_022530 [Odontesthes bonariensis]